jgi:hypothetical protein
MPGYPGVAPKGFRYLLHPLVPFLIVLKTNQNSCGAPMLNELVADVFHNLKIKYYFNINLTGMKF